MGEVIEFRRRRSSGFIIPDVDRTAAGFPDPLSTASAIGVIYFAIWTAFAAATVAAWLAKH